MALDIIDTVEIIEIMENYISKIRPSKAIGDKLDINYRIDNQSIILFEIRPLWDDYTKHMTHEFAKATYDKKNSVWKIYWLRANLKWNLYKPKPSVKTLPDFLKVLDVDEFACFKG